MIVVRTPRRSVAVVSLKTRCPRTVPSEELFTSEMTREASVMAAARPGLG